MISNLEKKILKNLIESYEKQAEEYRQNGGHRAFLSYVNGLRRFSGPVYDFVTKLKKDPVLHNTGAFQGADPALFTEEGLQEAEVEHKTKVELYSKLVRKNFTIEAAKKLLGE